MNLFRKSPNWSNFFGLDDSEENSKKEITFGEVLKKYRENNSLTTSELAKRSSVSQSYISQLENDLKIPSNTLIEKLAYGLINYNLNPVGDSLNYRFDDEAQKDMFEFYKEKLLASRDLIRIKDIHINIDEIDEQEEEAFISLYKSLSDEDKKQVIKYMNFLLHS